MIWIDVVHPANSCVSSRFIQLWDSIRWTCHYEETTWHQVTSTSVSLTKAQQAVVDLVLWLGRKRGPLSQTSVNRCLWCNCDQTGNDELIRSEARAQRLPHRLDMQQLIGSARLSRMNMTGTTGFKALASENAFFYFFSAGDEFQP